MSTAEQLVEPLALVHKYRIRDYDLWGNDKDGYEVNDVRDTGFRIEISDDETDESIIKKMKECGFLKEECRVDSFIIDGEPDYTLYVTYSTDKTCMPFCQLERI